MRPASLKPARPAQARSRRISIALIHTLLAVALLLQPALARPALAQEPPPVDPMPADPTAGSAAASVTYDVVPAADPPPPPIVISEIYAKPPLDTDRHEFIELYNPTSKAVSLAFWTLSGAVDFSFPGSAVIPAQGYVVVAENPAALRARYGTAAALVYGPFVNNLSIEGEEIVLRNEVTTRVDSVDYGYGFPWPVAGASDGHSIQLINTALNNELPGAWRAQPATPAAPNAGSVPNPPPLVQSVTHTPPQPKPGEAPTVSVVVTDTDGIGAVSLAYQVVTPGAYIGISDGAYNTQWTTVAMAAAGPVEGGLLYRAQLPPQQSRTLVRYRVQAADAGGRSVALPYPEDPQPNFAYFVYGALPSQWSAGLRPGDANSPWADFNFNTMRALPVYFFIAKNGDVTDAMHMPPSQQQPYMGNEYKWRGTFVYNGVVYDHVGFRPTGALRRFATGKTNWRFDFLAGHRFQAYDDFGQPYSVLRDNINLRGEMGHIDRDRRGELGMFESMSYKLFELAGVPASDTNFVHYRVITGASEYGNNQYEGDFWGLYLSIENPDEQFLEERDLPDGNLYKIESTAPAPGVNYYEGDLNNLGRNGPADKSDLGVLSYYAQQSSQSAAAWWRSNVDLENYYSFRSIVEFVHHYDMGEGKNYMFYNNPETKKWAIYPWDLDLTWHDTRRYFGTAQEPWACKALGRCYDAVYETFTPYSGPFNVEFQGRLRELRDLLLNPEQLFPMLDEQVALIDTPASTASKFQSIVAADRFKWDYNPIYDARWGNPAEPRPYVDTDKSARGAFYKCATGIPGTDCWTDGTFRGMVAGMKTYANQRFGWIDSTLVADAAIPETPTIANAGSFAADQIRFAASPFSDPQGAGSFAAMEWRVADVTPASPRNYEIDAAWESGVLPIYQNTVAPPAGVVQPGRTYRARVRMMDNTGRWSHWSSPLQFAATAPTTPVMQDLLLAEVMYNPLSWGNTPGDELEFIELTNKTNRTVTLGGLRVTGGIDFTFPPNSVVGPNKTIVLAKDARAFARRYGFNPFGAYDRKLSNGGDTIEIVDAWGRSVLKVTYSDKEPWPLDADGKGYSLTYSPALGAPANGASWRRSLSIGGSPGGPEPVSIVINELQLNPPLQRAVELYNPGELEVDVSRWFLSDSTREPRKVWLPDNSKIPPRGYLVVGFSQLNQPSFDGRLELDPPVSNQIVLSAGNAAGTLTGYQMRVTYPPLEAGVSFGRILDSLGRASWVLLARPTIGSENSGPRLGPLVISAINYAPTGGMPEYVELTNSSAGTVALFDRNNAQAWALFGGYMNIPAGITLRPGERLLAVSVAPEVACQTLGNRGFVRIVGPYTPQLSDTGQMVALMQPPAAAGQPTWITNDAAQYASSAPWPAQAAGQGAALRRVDFAAWGSDPIAWQPSADLPGVETAATTTTLCSFTAIPNTQGKTVLTWALAGATLDASVTGFKIYRTTSMDFVNPVEVATVAVAESVAVDAAGVALANAWSVTDPSASPGAPAYYWLKSSGAGGALVDLGQTSRQTPYQFIYMPAVKR